jgi:hypothetical protein
MSSTNPQNEKKKKYKSKIRRKKRLRNLVPLSYPMASKCPSRKASV